MTDSSYSRNNITILFDFLAFMDMTVKEYEKRGYDKVFLKAYMNMKQANCKDDYICAMLGISANKLRQIKKQEDSQEGEKRGKKEGRDEALLKAYINMKQANCKNNFICTMLGISASKLRQIKKMAETVEKSSVNNYALEA